MTFPHPLRPARAPALQPVNLYCIGKNYAEHAAEFGSSVGPYPVVFMKPVTCVIGPDEPICLPRCSPEPEVDYEVELGVVIGRPGKDIAIERAMEHVRGYVVANDVSARWWQKHGGGGQWVRGKSFDTFCPLGDTVVPAHTVPDPQRLTLRTTLNGQVMQEDSTANMVFSIAQIIAFLSRDTTLLTDTLILTGTPSGVGFARRPPVFLKPGDELVVEIEGVGRLSNPIIAA